MAKVIDSTNLGYLVSKIKAAFWPKTDTVQISIDASPTANSTNLVTSGGVYSGIHPSVASAQPVGGMLPNVLYNLGTLTGTVSFTLATPADPSIMNHYYWTFTTGSSAPTITWPASISSWFGGQAPTIEADKHYEVSVLNGVGILMTA